MKNIKTFEDFVNENKVNENSEPLSRFLDKEYKDYEHGNPQQGAKALIKATDAFIKECEDGLKKFGPFLSPGAASDLREYITMKLKNIKYK